MKLKSLIFIIMIAAASNAFSQGGSNYSLFGVGDLNASAGATYDALSGTSIAFPSESGINTINPALWSKVTMTRLQGGYMFNQNIISDQNSTLMQNNGKVSGILGLFSIDTSLGASVSFGVYPYSNVNYLVTTRPTVNLEGQELSAITQFQGEGGISQAYIGGSFSILSNLSLGATIFTSFGHVQSTVKTTINDQNSKPSGIEKTDAFSGWGLKGGLYYTLFDNISVGAYVENHMRLQADRKTRNISETIKDTSYTSREIITLPPAFGFGISYLTGKFVFAADLNMQDFSNYTFNEGRATFRNSMGVSLGVSRLGTKGYTTNFMDKVYYNFGLGYKQLYYAIVDPSGAEHGIDEYSGSFGVEMPIMTGAFLNAAVTLGSRGTKDFGLVHESFVRFTFDISLGEEWFKPYRGGPKQ